MEKIVTILVLQFIGKGCSWLLKVANMGKNRFDCSIAVSLEMNGVS